MNKNFNIAIIGLGQIVIIYIRINQKKDIEKKTGKKINIVAVSVKIRIKKGDLKLQKDFLF